MKREAALAIRDGSQKALVQRRLRRRWTYPSEAAAASIHDALRHYYYKLNSDVPIPSELARDFDDHTRARLWNDRTSVVPWLATLFPLDGARIVEIGCGTGSSTVALAEQGAIVTGYDFRADSLAAAQVRCKAHGVFADLRAGNAVDIPGSEFTAATAVIYFACLEHMTSEERLASLRQAWEGLPSGARLVVIETPNRLWWYDYHTSMLPFYGWLPDDLAIQYAGHSPRASFGRTIREAPPSLASEKLAREGRGVSYHEFELALDCDASNLDVFGMRSWLRRNPVHAAKWALTERAFQRILRRAGPSIHPAFYEYQLDLAIRKP